MFEMPKALARYLSLPIRTSIVVGLLLALPATAGVVFEVETTDHQSRQVETTEIMAEGKNLKMEILPGEGSGATEKKDEMVYRGDRREMVVVDHLNQAYMVVDAESLKAIGGQMAGMQDQLAIARQQLQERLGNMTEEQKRALEQALGNPAGGAGNIFGPGQQEPIEIRKTNERANKQGYPCVRHDVYRGDQKIRELWVTDWSSIEGGSEASEAFSGMVSFFEQMGEQIPTGELDEMKKFFDLDGFPVVGRSFEDGDLEEEWKLRSASRRTLDPADFEPPAGYKRRSMFPGG